MKLGVALMTLALGCSSPTFVVIEGELELETSSTPDAPVRFDAADASSEHVGDAGTQDVVDVEDTKAPVKETAIDTKEETTESDTCCGVPCGC